MSYQKNSGENKITAKVKRQTEKAYLIITNDAGNARDFREYWIPKSQILTEVPNKKNSNCVDLSLSDWIFEKMEPSSDKIYANYDGIEMNSGKPKAGAKQYSLKPNKYKSRESAPDDSDLTPNPDDDDIPF